MSSERRVIIGEMDASPALQASSPTRWWEGAAIYQIYVRSFRDSNGDGYGDLAGVSEKLEYLSWLGVDAIWLSPTMPSPDDDWGYDVADYYGVHPELGTLADLDALISAAAEVGIRVLLDLVPNHTSAAHPWFVDACGSKDAEHRDYYVWTDPAAGGGPPNNWLDATGACAWTLDPASGQYYLHNFLPSQPDLNWWNPAVADEFSSILEFWFNRGVAGFRIDVAHGLYKDAELRDDPPAPVSLESEHGLRQAYSKNRPEVHELYRAWRKIADAYTPARLLLGETWVLDPQRMAAFYGRDDELQLAFNFSFLFCEFTAPALRAVVSATFANLPEGACPVWAGSNHDVSRLGTRWADGDERRVRLALAVLCTLPGTTVLYYGDELGATDVEVSPSEQRDAMSRGARFNRDSCRTPMPWSPAPGGDFSNFEPSQNNPVPPWLPMGDNLSRNVEGQRDDPYSVLSLTRALIALRRGFLAGSVMRYEELPAEDDLWIYRSGPLLVAANFSNVATWVCVGDNRALLSTIVGDIDLRQGKLHLAPWQGVVLSSGSRREPSR